MADASESSIAALVRIDLAEVDPMVEKLDRQARWREKGLVVHREVRARRLARLNGRAKSIQVAVDAYRQADPTAGCSTVLLRRRFARLDPARSSREQGTREFLTSAQRQQADLDEVASRPPLTKLVHRPSNSLSLYLTAVYMAHLESAPGKAVTNQHRSVFKEGARASWADLAGLGGSSTERTRRARIRRAVNGLEGADLVAMPPEGTLGRNEQWQLLSDDGSGARYKTPGASAGDVIALPSMFFRRGWHLVLTPPEVAMLIAIMELAQRSKVAPDGRARGLRGVGFPESVKWGWYGMSGEVYEAAHMLHEFDLVDFMDPMPNRRRGKSSDPGPGATDKPNLERVPYNFYPPKDDAFDRPALEVVRERLEVFRAPFRLDDNAELLTPAQLATERLRHKNS